MRLKLDMIDIPSISVINDNEVILADSISIKDDSLFFKLPIFNSIFKAKITSDSTFEGRWFNYHKAPDYSIPFHASLNTVEPVVTNNPISLGNWEVTFSKGTEDESKAIGVFKRKGNSITGTFLTETGDYRFLEGKINTDSLFYMSCFDGSHAFYFNGQFTSDSIISNGRYYSGKHWNETWEGIRNDTFKLKDPYTLTVLNPGYDRFTFSFPNTEGKKVSLDDPQFKDKVVIIQIMGSWCPNCMDESRYFKNLYASYKDQGLEIIALAYEAKADFNYAKERVEKLRESIGISYPILIAGTSNKEEASKTLPMLNKIMSFPTTIVLDRDHNIQSIYTGFSGPSTGDAFLAYKKETEKLIEKLLKK